MPMYPEELIEEVRSRNDIVDVVGSYVRLQRKGSNYFGLCPFHNEKTPSFSVVPRKQMYYCFGCGAGGNVFTFLMQHDNMTFSEALELLADRAGVELPRQELSEEARRAANRKELLLQVNRDAATYYYALLRSPRGKRAYEYFKGRALSDETMKQFGLGYSDQYSDDLYRYLREKGYEDSLLKDSGLVGYDERRGGHDKFWNRAMFPIMNARNKVIGFGGRVMGEGEPKYLNSPETMIFDKSRNLYGLHLARRSKAEYLLLCEGYMDVIALHQAGFDSAVASLGTSLTSGHANLLRRFTRQVYLTYDSDGAGVKAALRAIPILKEVGIETKVIDMRPYKDPDEFIKALGAQEYRERIQKAENSFMYELRMLERDYDLGDPGAKTAFLNAVATKLLGFREELERNNYIETVAQKYRVEVSDLKKLVGRRAMSQEGLTQVRREPKSGVKPKEKKNFVLESQKLLLTWLCDDERLFAVIGDYVRPEDFTEEPYHQVAAELYRQHQEGAVNAARIISMFEEEEQQRVVAAIFNASIQKVENPADREKALKEMVLNVKIGHLQKNTENTDPNDLQAMMQLVRQKQELEQLKKMHFSLKL